MIDRSEQIELDLPSDSFEVGEDRRPKIEEPPPVRLISIDDCVLWAPAGLERQLDEFYVGLLKFEREENPEEDGAHELVYRAENFRVRIQVLERPIPREDYRPLTLVVNSVNDLARRLTEAKIEYQRQRGLIPGLDSLLLNDPAGNPVSVGEYRAAI
jgi:hypothetical protein